MTRAWGSLATSSIDSARRRRHPGLRSIAAVAAGLLLLAACGGDDDDDSSTSSTTNAPIASTAPTSALTETTVTTTTVPAPPSTIVYVTEGASVIVTNASRVDGAAARMSERLGAVGFTMVEPGNYSLGTIEVTKIYHDPANPQALAVAQSLKDALGGGAIEVIEMGSPPPVDGGDLHGATVQVAMGNDTADKTLDELQGITPPATTAPATTEATGESSSESSSESTTASTSA